MLEGSLIKHQLPQIYHALLPNELLQASVVEKLATCGDCAMTKEKRGRKKPVYQPDLKCCTYEPFMTNFFVGAQLKQFPESLGTQVLKDKIEKRIFSLPIGMTATFAYQVAFNHRKPEDFGQKREWLCSYYDVQNNLCSVWKNRSSVCSTFFCQSSYGKKGLIFWQNLSDYLSYVEMALMEEALVYLDFSPRQISDLLDFLNRFEASPAEMKMKVLPENKAKAIWNGYYLEQEVFYKKCYEIVSGFSKSQFREAIGLTGEEIEQRLFESMEVIQ